MWPLGELPVLAFDWGIRFDVESLEAWKVQMHSRKVSDVCRVFG